MFQRQQHAGRSVHKLFDHLDIALTSCADLRRGQPESLDIEDGAFPMRAELTAISHLLQARELVKEVALGQFGIFNQASRFLEVTQPLEAGATVGPTPKQVGPMLGRRVALSEIAQATSDIVSAIERYSAPAQPARDPIPMVADQAA